MDVKQAVAIAKKYVQELFGDEKIANVGLEEAQFDQQHDAWKITVGFSRPWDEPQNVFSAIALATKPSRSYKVVLVSNESGEAISIQNRDE